MKYFDIFMWILQRFIIIIHMPYKLKILFYCSFTFKLTITMVTVSYKYKGYSVTTLRCTVNKQTNYETVKSRQQCWLGDVKITRSTTCWEKLVKRADALPPSSALLCDLK